MKETLFYTSLLPIIVVFFYLYRSNKNIYENMLIFGIILLCITSLCFWENPIQYSYEHFTDLYMVKIVILLVIFYTLFIKKLSIQIKAVYSFLVILLFISAYYSHFYSSIEWCSREHITAHICLHLLAFVGVLFAFV